MTERELQLYEALAALASRSSAVLKSERAELARIAEMLEGMADLKAERLRRREQCMIDAGWVREGNGWALHGPKAA
jgi:K+/H+ antiporter YhaU regulatory subunit KhtT